VTSSRLTAGRDSGAVTAWFVLFATVWFSVFGSLIVGGSQIRHLQLAENIAAEAARAGGQTLKFGDAVSGGAKTIDQAKVGAAVANYLQSVLNARPDLVNVTGTLGAVTDTTLEVTVVITYQRPNFIPWPTSTSTATGTAKASLLFIDT
jgi:hypothetical protein